MTTPMLTTTEARVLFTALHSSWIPVIGSEDFRGAVKKLGIIGGGFCCRDCTEIGKYPHRLGGLVCDTHAGPRPPLQTYPPTE